MTRRKTPELNHAHWMAMALQEAHKGIGLTSPNPPVGAVIVHNNRLISKGYHHASGQAHAEINALKSAGIRAKGATVYITLEPCSTAGKTGPCVEALINASVGTVVYGCDDPNPGHRGKGEKLLKRAGIQVHKNILKEDCVKLIRPFATAVLKKRPYITLKLAQSLDGKIAAADGSSKWISGPESRAVVQEIRKTCDAILVGVNTVRRDNPSLDLRPKGKSPWFQVIVDSRLEIPPASKCFNTKGITILLTTSQAPASRIRKFGKSAEVIVCKSKLGRVDLKDAVKHLVNRGICHLLVEGGGEISSSVIENGLADDLYLFIAPILIGGKSAPTSFDGTGISNIKKAIRLKDLEPFKTGSDFCFYGRF